IRRHALGSKFRNRTLILREMRQSHAAQDVRGLGELDVVVANDLYAVAPGVEEIEKLTGQHLHARLHQGAADGFLVIDHQSKMTAVVGGLSAALLECQKLIAQVDEGRGVASAAKLEFEEATVKRQRFVDITDFERDMVETHGARFLWMSHKHLLRLPRPVIWCRTCGNMGAKHNKNRPAELRRHAKEPPRGGRVASKMD